MKIVVVGGASTYTPELIDGFARLHSTLPVSEVVLVDPAEDRLDPPPVQLLTGFVSSQGLFLATVSAGALVVSLPVIAVGVAAQDKLVQGLTFGAVK